MQQICIDLRSLPEADGFKHLVVRINYFSKSPEVKPIKDKSASIIAQFQWKFICWHGYMRCAKSVRVRNYSGPHFSAFGLNAERYSVCLRIQFECGKMRTTITPNTDILYAVMKVQINHQGMEFVNEVSKVLHSMIDTEEPMTSAYHF